MATGLIFNIQRYSLHDGPGIRTTVFFKGCPLNCWWCHNPEGQSARPEIIMIGGRCCCCDECKRACPDPHGACILCGKCVNVCPTLARQMIGQERDVANVMEIVRTDRLFYDESAGGVTFSGGEPLMQGQFLRELLGACRSEGIHTALDTSGFAAEDELLASAALADLVLYDLKTMDDQKHIRYTGVSNKLILENLKALGKVHRNIWVRIPIIPGLNDSDAEVEGAARFAAGIAGVTRVCLLPYHKTGLHKFQRVGRKVQMPEVSPPSTQRMCELAQRFSSFGLNARTGG